ncbi:uncharacterized protein LOC127241106 [Andrographis paniculata]|uniref:uncharacterized protein LOC127241106 n=1 Tax=Andrographis paniculata TaxID=175694 RepID=UPI0021E70947|nr:uncharacterized protein LOC127241106 [Andrographis paniculata]XP_051115962.1 uncharacterized protein LOC127241106 [Andrographis paniculata]
MSMAMGLLLMLLTENGLSDNQIGTFTARMTEAACQTFAYSRYLWESLEKVARHGSHSLNSKYMEAVEEAIHFLKVFHPRKSQEMESLLRKMALATNKENVVIHRLCSETLKTTHKEILEEDANKVVIFKTQNKSKLWNKKSIS